MRVTKIELTVASFLANVDTQHASGCWIWRGYIAPNIGYGQCTVNGKTHWAHRISWELFRGRHPGKALVCHTCDRRDCVRPDHFFLGNKKSNAADMMKKGRGRYTKHIGVANGNTRVDEAAVGSIRAAAANGERQQDIAQRMGISQSTVSQIVRRFTWRHVIP